MLNYFRKRSNGYKVTIAEFGNYGMVLRRWFVASGCIALLLSSCDILKPKSLSSGEIAAQAKASVVLISYQHQPGNGTGFFIQGATGVCTVLTVRHVVTPSDQLLLQTPDQKQWKDVKIQRFPNHDLALVTFKPDGENCPYSALNLGNSDSLQVGEDVYISGFPGGSGRLLSQFVFGKVSAIENVADGYGVSYAATTAGGMSGGPVFNSAGQVVAIHGRTDTEIARLVQLTSGTLPQQQQQSTVSNNSGEVAAQVGTFKWGIPMNVYQANVANISSSEAVAKSAPKTAEDWLTEGNDLFVAKRYEEAIAAYDKAIKVKPDYSLAWYNKGSALNELKRYESAITSYEKAIEANGEWGNRQPAEAWTGKGFVLNQLKRYDDAIASYDKAIQFKPDFAIAWYNRGNALNYLKQYEEAITSYDKAIQLKPDDHQSWAGRGKALIELKQYEEALVSYEKAVQIKPDYALGWYSQGNGLIELKRYEEAIASFDKALQLNGEWDTANPADAWDNRGVALWHLKRYEEALASHNKAIQLGSNDYSNSWTNRCNVLISLQRYEEAIASCDKAIELKPDFALAWSNRGSVLFLLKRYEEAIASYEKAIQLKPDYADAWTGKGMALYELKRYDEALESYDKAIKLDPSNQIAINNRKQLLSQLGRTR